MPISIVMWIMILSLVVTYILLNIFEIKRMKKSDRRFEPDRRTSHMATTFLKEEMEMTEGLAMADKKSNYLYSKTLNLIQQAVPEQVLPFL